MQLKQSLTRFLVTDLNTRIAKRVTQKFNEFTEALFNPKTSVAYNSMMRHLTGIKCSIESSVATPSILLHIPLQALLKAHLTLSMEDLKHLAPTR